MRIDLATGLLPTEKTTVTGPVRTAKAYKAFVLQWFGHKYRMDDAYYEEVNRICGVIEDEKRNSAV